MYVDQKQKDLIADTTDKDGNSIKDVHAMDYNEALAITGNTNSTTGLINTGAYYWLASAYQSSKGSVWNVDYDGNINHTYSYNSNIGGYDAYCRGVRPVVSLTSGVYIKSGAGTDTDPYILGKD